MPYDFQDAFGIGVAVFSFGGGLICIHNNNITSAFVCFGLSAFNLMLAIYFSQPIRGNENGQ